MQQKVKCKCDKCKKMILADPQSLVQRVVEKDSDPKFYCYKCCYEINKGTSAICPQCCDYVFCSGEWKTAYYQWLNNIKGV